ncbi:MAG: CoA transferase, partial [Micromonosporaceae bacterium]
MAATADETVAAEVILRTAASEAPLTCVVTWSADENDTRVRDEVSAQAVCGVMHLHGRRWGRPVAIHANYCGIVAATVAMQGILAALLARARGTQIREVRTSVVHATLVAIAHYVAVATADDGGPFDLSPGGPPLRSADEVVFQPEFTTGGAWAAFWQELHAEPRAADLGWRVWSPFALTATIPLPEELFSCAKQHPFTEIQRAAAVSGGTVQPLRSLADRARELGLHTGAPVPAPWILTKSRGLRNACVQPPALTAPPTQAPLSGVTLVEATRRILGPLSGRALAMLGADVVHIEPPGGDPFRDFPPLVDDCSAVVRCMTVGKRVVELDLKAQSDRPALHALLDGADIFLQNWAPGKAGVLGLTPAELHARNPR